MKYNIIGWYGTETLGDIAILDGILKTIEQVDNNAFIYLGSLFPFYSERTLLYNNLSQQNNSAIPIIIYDIKDPAKRSEIVSKSDVLIIGGGPLMPIHELKILLKTFQIAKKKDIPRVIWGCGIAPFPTKEYQMVLKQLFQLADSISFRDAFSKEKCKEMGIETNNCEVFGDPAIISIEQYKIKHNEQFDNKSYYAVNLRDCRASEYADANGLKENQIERLLSKLSEETDVCLVPMHTFFVGGDDRDYYCRLLGPKVRNRIKVLHEPMSLQQVYMFYACAKACIGMRYHSVVMQTILNGNNVIFEYTNKKGKTDGFLSEYDSNGFYLNRRINLHNNVTDEQLYKVIEQLNTHGKFIYKSHNILSHNIEFIQKQIK